MKNKTSLAISIFLIVTPISFAIFSTIVFSAYLHPQTTVLALTISCLIAGVVSHSCYIDYKKEVDVKC